MSNFPKYNDTTVWIYMMLAKYRGNKTDWEDIENVLAQASHYINQFENDERYKKMMYFQEYLDEVQPKYYHCYMQDDTLWIIDKASNIAYETKQYEDWVPANGIFIRHDMSDWHSDYIKDIEIWEQVIVPTWFFDIVK